MVPGVKKWGRLEQGLSPNSQSQRLSGDICQWLCEKSVSYVTLVLPLAVPLPPGLDLTHKAPYDSDLA